MGLLKQTALILGLASLAISGWTLYRGWRQRIAIQFSIICLIVSAWALSFVYHLTLQNRLAYDVHRFFHLWLAPLGVILLSGFLSQKDRLSHFLTRLSLGGAGVLSIMVAFALNRGYDSSPIFWWIVKFWPAFVLFQFFNVVYQDRILKRSMTLDFLSQGKRTILYVGIPIALLTCSFDHIPELGEVVPSIGNLLFAAFLAFSSQVLSPQKFFRAEALLSRFFATLILALLITAFFALLFPFFSDSFPLFLLNSFLLSFFALVIWSPLVTLFSLVSKKIFQARRIEKTLDKEQVREQWLQVFSRRDLIQRLNHLLIEHLDAVRVQVLHRSSGAIPLLVDRFVQVNLKRNESPILLRPILRLQIEQELTRDTRQTFEELDHFLSHHEVDVAFPVLQGNQVEHLILIQSRHPDEELENESHPAYARFRSVFDAIQAFGAAWVRLEQMDEARESERLRLLGELAAGLAHEIRNPLGVIQSATGLLGTQDSGLWIQVIREEVERLNRLVSQFLDLSQNRREHPQKQDLVVLLNKMMQPLQLAEQTKIPQAQIIWNPIDSNGVQKDSVWVNLVADHLRQILLNLVQNAIQSYEGLGRNPIVTLDLFETSVDQRKWVGISIADQGRGIPESDRERIFAPFFTTSKQGSGLGLSICQRLVQINHGELLFESNLQGGTTVKVMFPHA